MADPGGMGFFGEVRELAGAGAHVPPVAYWLRAAAVFCVGVLAELAWAGTGSLVWPPFVALAHVAFRLAVGRDAERGAVRSRLATLCCAWADLLPFEEEGSAARGAFGVFHASFRPDRGPATWLWMVRCAMLPCFCGGAHPWAAVLAVPLGRAGLAFILRRWLLCPRRSPTLPPRVRWLSCGWHLGMEAAYLPDVSAWFYPSLAPGLREICGRHGIPYHTD
jgi:hypothetical protein